MNDDLPKADGEDHISSRFSICSDTLSCAEIALGLPRHVTESFERGTPTGQVNPATHPFSIVVFDLGVPPSDRADVHLQGAVAALGSVRELIQTRSNGCGLCLWIACAFAAKGAVNIRPDLMRLLADLGVECMIQLNRSQQH